MLSYGQILYAYTNLGIRYEKEVFTNEDTRKFYESLLNSNLEKGVNILSWNGIYPVPITPQEYENQVLSDLYTKKINNFTLNLQKQLIYGDWKALKESFPDSPTVNTEDGLVNFEDLNIQPISYKPFFPEWDKVFKGLLDEDFIIIFAMPKMGKSTLLSYLAYEAIKNGHTIGFYATELSREYTTQYILGWEYGAIGSDALELFNKVPQALTNLMQKYAGKIKYPLSDTFIWSEYEKLYTDKDVEMIFHDNFITSHGNLPSVGKDDSSYEEFSKKLGATFRKYKKPTFMVTQEGERDATEKEKEKNPDRKQVGRGTTFRTRSLGQEATLMLNIVPSTTVDNKLVIVHDRFRSLNNLISSNSISISQRTGKLETTVIKDSTTTRIINLLKTNPELRDQLDSETLSTQFPELLPYLDEKPSSLDKLSTFSV